MPKFKSVNVDFDNNLMANYALRDLVITKKGVKKGLGNNYAVNSLLRGFLNNYGIDLFGETPIQNLNGEHTDTLVLCSHIISLDIPIENLMLFDQIYSWNNAIVNICYS